MNILRLPDLSILNIEEQRMTNRKRIIQSLAFEKLSDWNSYRNWLFGITVIRNN